MAIPVAVSSDWLTIVNPNAGLKKAARDWKNISYLLKRNDIRYFSVFTERRLHAITLTRELLKKGYRKILVVGGDGTLNEVVNGIFTQNDVNPRDLTLAMIPVGTGNDWCRMYNIPF
ncbi:MAG: acylglycerol kinase family protein, partial [Bacteroidetes bacterium]|nr:acylglycerol kinase family protein [Bacteroidota bacterium]